MLRHAIVASLFCTSLASAQVPLWNVQGGGAGDTLGYLVGGAGDANGDGRDDVFVWSYYPTRTVQVFSGLDGVLLHTFAEPATAVSQFGNSVCGAGDVNADGFDDLLVSDYTSDAAGGPGGSAWVFSGLDGAVLHALHGNKNGDDFGLGIAGLGDLDHDGCDDFVISAPGFDGVKPNSGRATVFSGRNGTKLHVVNGSYQGQAHGRRVAGAGDVDGDGTPDFAVSRAKGFKVLIYSGKDASILQSYSGDPQSGFGTRLAAGDLNADGTPDLLVGAPAESAGSVYAYSGADGSQLFSLHGTESDSDYGWRLDVPGDLDGDGSDDFVLGTHMGYAEVYSGSGELLYRLHGGGTATWVYGFMIAGAGDVNADGQPDLVVGDNLDGANGNGAGAAWVYSGWNPVGAPYCGPAVPNSTGMSAAIGGLGSSLVSDELLILSARQLPTEQFAYFLVSDSQGFTPNPGGSQGSLCLASKIGRFQAEIQNSGIGGAVSLTIDLGDLPFTPGHAVQPGETWNFQAWFRDSNPGATSNFTDALSVTFQ